MLINACTVILIIICESLAFYDKEYTPNVGTVLFSSDDVKKTQWAKTDIGLLRARRYFQTLLPPPIFINTFNEDYVNILLEYFRDAYSAIKREAVDRETDTIMTTALSDAIGGYLQVWVLPVAKLDYYGGTVSQDNVVKIFQFFNEIKRYLDTDGGGWRKPDENVLNSITINVAPLKYVSNTRSMKDPCDRLAYFEKTPNGLGIPIPYVNWNDKASTMFVPLKNVSLIPMNSPDSSNNLIKYYDAAKSCIQSSNPKDQDNFDERFQTWLTSDVLPHLKDENLYLALGSVLTLVNRTRELCNNVIDLYSNKKVVVKPKPAHMPVDFTSKKTLIICVILLIEVAWCIPALIYILCSKKVHKKDCSSNVYLYIENKDKKDKGAYTKNKPGNLKDGTCSAILKDIPVTESQCCRPDFKGGIRLYRKSQLLSNLEFEAQYPSSQVANTGAGTRSFISSKVQSTNVADDEHSIPIKVDGSAPESSVPKITSSSVPKTTESSVPKTTESSDPKVTESSVPKKTESTKKSEPSVPKRNLLSLSKRTPKNTENVSKPPDTTATTKTDLPSKNAENSPPTKASLEKMTSPPSDEKTDSSDPKITVPTVPKKTEDVSKKLETSAPTKPDVTSKNPEISPPASDQTNSTRVMTLSSQEAFNYAGERSVVERYATIQDSSQTAILPMDIDRSQRGKREKTVKRDKNDERKKAEERKPLDERKRSEERKLLDEHKKAQERKLLNERKKSEERKLLDEHKKTEERKLLNERKKSEERKLLEEHRKSEERKQLDKRRQVDESKLIDERVERKPIDERKLHDKRRQHEESKQLHERKKSEECKLYDERRKLDESKQYDEFKKIEERRKAEECRKYEERNKVEESKNKKFEDRIKVDECRRLEERKNCDESRKLEERKRADESRKLEERKKAADESRRQERKKLEEYKKFEERRKANESYKKPEETKLKDSVTKECKRKVDVEERENDEPDVEEDESEGFGEDNEIDECPSTSCKGPVCPCIGCIKNCKGVKSNSNSRDNSLDSMARSKIVADKQIETKTTRFQVSKEYKTLKGKSIKLSSGQGQPYLEITIDRPTTEISLNVSRGQLKQNSGPSKPSKIPKPATYNVIQQPLTTDSGTRSRSRSPSAKRKSLIPQLKKKTVDDIAIIEHSHGSKSQESRLNDTF